jgi:hypothetical protein
MAEPFFLPPLLTPTETHRQKLESHYHSGILVDASIDLPAFCANEYDLDLRAKYGPIDIPHPIGKASGQLSLQPKQIQADADSGIAFAVLKTVIAEDERGGASMEAWKIKKPRMVVERIEGRRVARSGWTVSWAGRGWEGSLESYLEFMREALAIGAERAMPVIPSCKYNLPADEGTPFLNSEYEYTTRRLNETWREVVRDSPLVLEQDFSPTLAGTDAATSKRLILKWLRESPALIKAADPNLILGVKLMNALFADEFQLDMMELLSQRDSPADFLVCFNRLFDPQRPSGDKTGIAYGGPDLSDRNLKILRQAILSPRIARPLPISATGDIATGRMMIEYALRGATGGQLHTFLQLPMEEYSLKSVSRSRAALHEIYLHPRHGIIASMCHIRDRWIEKSGTLAFLDLPGIGRDRAPV